MQSPHLYRRPLLIKTILVANLAGWSLAPITFCTARDDALWTSADITQLCSKFDETNRKFCDYEKSQDKYLYLESAYGLDWITLRSDCNRLKSALRMKVWTSNYGKYKVRASLKMIDAKSVKLAREDSGKTVMVRIDRLDKSAQAVIGNVHSCANRLKNSINLIEDGRRPRRISAEQFTDAELTSLVISQSKVLPSNAVSVLDNMLTDPNVLAGALEKAKYPRDIQRSRLIRLLKATASANFLNELPPSNESTTWRNSGEDATEGGQLNIKEWVDAGCPALENEKVRHAK